MYHPVPTTLAMDAVNLTAFDREPPMLSRDRAARLVSISSRTLDRAIAAGSLRTVRLGHRRLIPRDALRAWLIAGLT